MKIIKTNRLFADNHKNLVENWYPKWNRDIRRVLPNDFVVSDEEIDSEITFQCQYLAQIFKFGSYVAYCNEFVAKRAANAFWREYKALDHDAITQAFRDYDDDYASAYECRHQHGEYETEEYTTIDKQLEINDLLEAIEKMTKDNIDAAIIKMILDGMTYDEIAEKLNISKGTIAFRMKNIGNQIRNKEKENA